jgi:hypothetical protein
VGLGKIKCAANVLTFVRVCGSFNFAKCWHFVCHRLNLFSLLFRYFRVSANDLRASEGRETKALNCKPNTNLKEISELSNYCKTSGFRLHAVIGSSSVSFRGCFLSKTYLSKNFIIPENGETGFLYFSILFSILFLKAAEIFFSLKVSFRVMKLSYHSKRSCFSSRRFNP